MTDLTAEILSCIESKAAADEEFRELLLSDVALYNLYRSARAGEITADTIVSVVASLAQERRQLFRRLMAAEALLPRVAITAGDQS